MEQAVDEKLKCSHCGEPCENRSISLDDHVFCCLGCKTVFEILHENGLDAYYRMEDNPGISLKHNRGHEYFNFLDNDDVRRRVLDFESEVVSKVRFYMPSIHCSSCIWLLENLYQLHKGVNRSEVNFPKKEIYIDFNPGIITLRELVELLASLGYEPEIKLERRNKETGRTETDILQNRSLLTRIGIAGFCFGNIMLLSFPEYLGLSEFLERDFSRFFSYANIILSLPVIFYSASGYFDAAYKGLKQKMISIDVPITIGILTLFLRSVYEVVSQIGPGYFDSLSGLVFFLLIGKWFQKRTYQNLLFDRNYKSYFPVAVTRLSGSGKDSILIEQLKENDRILIRNRELIPADCELISEGAMIDNSFVTGESRPIKKVKGDYIFAGGRQVGSAIELRVKKEVSQSYLTQLWNNEAFKKSPSGNRKFLVDRISKYFTIAILSIALVASLFWLYFDPSKTVYVFTSVLIVACPCALALSTPFAVGAAMRILGKNGCYLKNGDILEEMDKIDHIVFDKTGTITYHHDDGVAFNGTLSEYDANCVRSITSNSFHPLSRRITEYFNEESGNVENIEISNFQEFPGRGIQAMVSGRKFQLGSREFTDYTGEFGSDQSSASHVYLSIDEQIKGYFELKNHYRDGLQDVIKKMSQYGRISMLSGDNSSEKEFLKSIFPENSDIKFDQTAYSKLDYVKELQQEKRKVMMVGDGLNDAGALAQSSVGIAVTEDVNNFTPASDIILSGKEFKKLPEILRLSKATVWVILISFAISFLYNVFGIGFAISGKLTPVFAAILMPLSSISVVIFTTLSVQWLAKRIGFG